MRWTTFAGFGGSLISELLMSASCVVLFLSLLIGNYFMHLRSTPQLDCPEAVDGVVCDSLRMCIGGL